MKKGYTITQLSNISGLPETTISFWQKKYNVFPDLSLTKIKSQEYSNNHLKRLLNIASLFNTNKKYKLEIIGSWEDEELETKIEIEILSNLIKKKLNEDIIHQLITSTITYDDDRFNLIIDASLKKLSAEDFYKYVLYPFLVRVFDFFDSTKDIPVQFYFIINILEQKLHFLIQTTATLNLKKERILLILPEKEYYEIGLLFTNLLLKQLGYKTYYIGANQPNERIKQAKEDLNIDMIITFDSNSRNYKSYDQFFNFFEDEIDKIFIIGREITISKYKIPRKQKFYTIDEFNAYFENR